MQQTVELIANCYFPKQGKEKIVLQAFTKFGGFVLQDCSETHPKVVAAAVVEMNHRRKFDNSDDNHECIIIHYHTNFGKHLHALWHHMYKYMEKFDKLDATKYVYYCYQHNNFPRQNLTLCNGCEDFLETDHFDLGDDLNVFAEGKYFALHGNRKLFQGIPPTGFFDEARKIVVGCYQVHDMYNLPITSAEIQHHEDVDVFTCTYLHKYCAKKTVLLKDMPLPLRMIIGAGKEYKWEEVKNRILSDNTRSSMDMKLNRSGSVQVLGDQRCCAFDCIWKMLKYHPEFKDDAVAELMLKQRKEDYTQY